MYQMNKYKNRFSYLYESTNKGRILLYMAKYLFIQGPDFNSMIFIKIITEINFFNYFLM